MLQDPLRALMLLSLVSLQLILPRSLSLPFLSPLSSPPMSPPLISDATKGATVLDAVAIINAVCEIFRVVKLVLLHHAYFYGGRGKSGRLYLHMWVL